MKTNLKQSLTFFLKKKLSSVKFDGFLCSYFEKIFSKILVHVLNFFAA